MKLVVQRVTEASVTVGDRTVGRIDEAGLLVLVGVTHADTEADAAKLARKLLGLRILNDEKSVVDTGSPLLVVSQFTLYGDARKGRRPSWSLASGREHSEPLVEAFVSDLRAGGVRVETGEFGAMMKVASVNDGPFTVLLESAELA
ncbi:MULTISPECIES: D-aminoacyl-tRNA deacylase [unclassified Pseudoclavibacter]|uniref:D-aminoacyl-tRNA deacylase n=1 Tax=unclassified Pseudoclavibacter TaxID=2615177 RepID=UPI0012EF2E1F|nr:MULTISPECIES: D-aminoacyl-tRNA deacylase [unclassified Pseudoclavibacter]MBF4459858.1 D-tyrosyl-tRNA(Tyr) deacylase [Pseudoclavibacter sp. VKM Ac-2867]VXB47254.1 D-aminoacyl-tRNA deacylase [Pseudoclavibacter sp. 8L]